MAEPIPPADPTTGTWRLKQIGLAKLLHNLSISERTGTLVLKRGEVSKSIFFKNGYVMFAESNLATDRLGEVLCRRGEITRAQLSDCLTESKRTGKMLGAVLVEKNVLRAERLLPAIEVQVREIVLGAFSWDDGEYLFSKEFFGNTEDLLDLKIRSADLILEGVRRTYTATQASKTLGDTSRPPRLSAESGYLSQELTVNFETSKVLSKVDGQRSIAQIVAETGLTELTVLQILAALGHLKILDVESTGNTGKIGVSPASVPAPPPPTPAPGATDVRVRAARVEEMRAHDEVTQLLDRLPPLVSQLLFDAGAATPQVLAAAGPDADAIGRSFGNGRRILDVLQERNYTLELVRAVAHLFSAGALKPTQGQPAAGNGWQQPAAPAGGGWQAAPAGGQPSSAWQVPGGAVPAAGGAPAAPNAGFPATKAPPPPTASPVSAPPVSAGFPATKAPEPPSAGFPATKAPEPAAGFPATKAPAPPAPANGGGFGAPTGGGAWGAPVPAPGPAPVPPPAPSAPWQKGAAIPLGGGAPVPAPTAAPVAAAPPSASQPWGKPPEPPRPAAPPVSANAPIPLPSGPIPTPPPAAAPVWAAPPPPPLAGWGAPVAAAPVPAAVPPPPVAPSMPWAQPPAPTPGPTAARPTGPAVWNVPSAPTPPPPTPTIAAPPPPPTPSPWANGGQPSVAPATPVAAPVPAPTPAPAPSPAPLPPPEELLEISPIDEPATTKSKEANEPKETKPKPPKTEGGRSRLPLYAVGALVVLGGAVMGGSYLKLIPLEIPGITPAGTPIAAVTPTPEATATPAATETVVAMVTPAETPTSEATATPAATATVAATTPAATSTPAPTATAVAIVATPKPSPTATKAPEDPEVKKKKAVAQVKSGNDALNAGDGAKATKFFGMAIANDPTNAEAHLGLGTAYMILGDNPKAKKSFQKFLQLAPNHQYAAQTRQILGSL